MKTPIPHPDSFQQTGKQPIILFALSLIFALSILLPDKSLAQEAYVEISEDGNTLTFYCDNKRGEKTTTTYGIDEKNGDFPKWLNTTNTNGHWETEPNRYTTVIFHESFAGAKPQSCAYWFRHSPNLTTIEQIENLHTDDVITMCGMFDDCESLTELNLQDFNTSQVTNMNGMFNCCKSLKTLDLSSFSTEKVTDMGFLFTDCHSLKIIIFSETFTTSNVKDMSWMFHFCESLESLDISGFDTKSVTNMFDMFGACRQLKYLDVSSFDTQGVTDMCGMFNTCENLETIKFGDNFSTQSVTDMSNMFLNCSSLTNLDFPTQFNSESVTKMNSMFAGCNSLTELNLSSFITENVTDLRGMFSDCRNLQVVNLSSFNTKKVTDMRGMFANCENLTTILVSDGWNINKLSNEKENFQSPYQDYSIPIFSNCKKLIGNNGTLYSDKYESDPNYTTYHQDIKYANADYGYLTKDKYKIFYDLDGGSWGSNKQVSDFDLTRDQDIPIPNPVKDGFVFLGWNSTPSTVLTSLIKDLSIKPDEVGNRIYTAIWAPDLDIPETLSIPPVPGGIIDFCQNDNRSASFTVKLIDDWEITDCQISIPGFTAEYTPIPNDKECIITIASPEDTIPGRYQGNITLNQNDNTSYPITVDVAAVKGVVLHLYKDVIFVNNKGSKYKSSGYQWYKDGAEIPNANRQYLYDEEMSNDHTYMARMVTEKDDLTVYACEIPGGVDIAKSSPTPVKTYPNPAADGQEFSIEIMDFDPEASYAIKISNSNGVIVKEIHDATQISTIALPRGVYSGALISGGRKKGFKLIVR